MGLQQACALCMDLACKSWGQELADGRLEVCMGATGRELNYRDPKDQGKKFSLYDMESLLKSKNT